jgi:hypothetical protein
MNEHEIRPVHVLLADGTTQECELRISTDETCDLVFSGPTFGTRTFTGEDYFEHLMHLRAELENSGHRLLCQGGRPNVWPSGMSRDMGGGRKAYVMQMGSKARTRDLVDIFDYAAPELIGTVQQQKDFFESWWAEPNKKCSPRGDANADFSVNVYTPPGFGTFHSWDFIP